MEISLEKGLFPRSHPNFLEMLLKSKLSCLKRDLLSRLMKIYNLKIYFRLFEFKHSEVFILKEATWQKLHFIIPTLNFHLQVEIAQNSSFKEFCLSLSW